MRRSDREISDFSEIVALLARCDVVRIGMRGKDYPYVVPVSFGYEVCGESLTLYFHGAMQGKKHDLLAEDEKVCVEADIFHNYAGTGHGVTAEYESVIGFGTARAVEGEEAVRGIRLLLKHCGFAEDSAESCIAMGITRVYKIELESLTGKRRRL